MFQQYWMYPKELRLIMYMSSSNDRYNATFVFSNELND